MEVGEPHGESQREAMFSALPVEDGWRLLPECSPGDDLGDATKRQDVGTDHVELHTSQLSMRQPELEASEDFAGNGEDIQETPAVNPGGIARVIYAENKKKPRLAQAVFDNLGPKLMEPLYCQPSDTALHTENKKEYKELRKKLMLHFERRAQEGRSRADPSPDTPKQPTRASPNETGQKGNSAYWKVTEQKQRQFSEEQQFPVLKKKRQEYQRLPKAGQRECMGAGMQVIIGLHQPEKKCAKRNCAIIPPLLTDQAEAPVPRRLRTSGSGPVGGAETEPPDHVWDDRERKISRENFIENLKQFGVTASYLDKKSVADCIHYCYLSKKRENYKQFMCKPRA
ncbi:hypothetical protein HPB48_016048 [Haemaphysalis longicornis]|uniref:Uncharacterized protein n=1 Tax=Haemaphysalis longicornis TaxID=44386 RepID=A0A9J6GL29_HAELO|nr:hypothetical protein HPB48_016048 [Haemaphysalis longicornis]